MLKSINVSLVPAPILYEGATQAMGIYADTTHIIGFEFDGTACFRKGAKFGPNALRAVSDGIESYSPYLEADLDDLSFVDLGNLAVDLTINKNSAHSDVENAYYHGNKVFNSLFDDVSLNDSNVRIMTLGGEHSISYAPITKYLADFPNLAVLHLDAHADLRDGYLGYHHSHAAIIRRISEHFGEHHQLLQYGIRSGTKDEYDWMKHQGTLKASRNDFLEAVDNIPQDTPIYLTLDLDYFDPSFLPGTGTPEPGGEDFHSFVSLCKILKNKNFVGCDVVELSPEIDSTGNSDVFAAKVVRELLLCLEPRSL